MKFIDQILKYKPVNEQDLSDKNIILNYINDYRQNILLRENFIAHMTSSGFVINRECTKVLMIFHKIYNTWTWTGGHADGMEDLLEVALKEAKEETGLKNLVSISDNVYSVDILPVWGHFKKGKYISAHLHLNTSFILIGDEREELIVNEEETNGVKWILIEDMIEHSKEPFLIEIYLRLIEKAKEKLINKKI